MNTTNQLADKLIKLIFDSLLLLAMVYVAYLQVYNDLGIGSGWLIITVSLSAWLAFVVYADIYDLLRGKL